MSTNDRLRGAALQRARAIIRADNPLCVHCLEKGLVVPWEELDHVVPVEHGGTDDYANLQGLCKPCHARKTRMDRGYRVSGACGVDGLPTDPDHPWS